MKTIKERDLNEIQLVLQNQDPELAAEVLKFHGSFDREGSQLPLGEPSSRIFTRNYEVSKDLAQEVAKILEAFSKTPDGRSNGMGLRLVEAWHNFV
jgi:hypothetical protein